MSRRAGFSATAELSCFKISLDRPKRSFYRVANSIFAELDELLRKKLRYSFLPARRYASAGDSDRNVSVRPSVCLSVCHAPVLCQNEES